MSPTFLTTANHRLSYNTRTAELVLGSVLLQYNPHYRPPDCASDEQRPAVHAGYSRGSARLPYELNITCYDSSSMNNSGHSY